MKKIIYKYSALAIVIMLSLPAVAQPDTLTKPNRNKTFEDPKITDDNSKILIDTSDKFTDSLLNKKTGKNKNQRGEKNVMGEENKPVKIKRAPTDSSKRMARP